MSKFTVQGHLVEIDEPYNEGHTCTAGEADTLNQIRKENVRNNVASVMTREEEKNGKKYTAEEVQAMVTDYAKDYEFGVRSGQTRDPIEAEALDMAREIVKTAIGKKADLKLKDFKAAQITELAKNYLATPNGAILRERAKAVVAAREAVGADLNLDDVKVAA